VDDRDVADMIILRYGKPHLGGRDEPDDEDEAYGRLNRERTGTIRKTCFRDTVDIQLHNRSGALADA
jgi:hypothetical protein